MLVAGIQLRKQNSYRVLMMGEFFSSKAHITWSITSISLPPYF